MLCYHNEAALYALVTGSATIKRLVYCCASSARLLSGEVGSFVSTDKPAHAVENLFYSSRQMD